ncbi:MAG: hypothetical protein ACUVXI_04110 [bacterium]
MHGSVYLGSDLIPFPQLSHIPIGGKSLPPRIKSTKVIGRDREIQSIKHNIRKGVNILILGESGIGKTTILREITRWLKGGKSLPKPIEVDGNRSLKEITSHILLQLIDHSTLKVDMHSATIEKILRGQ